MKEANIVTDFRKFLKKYPAHFLNTSPAAIEFKICKLEKTKRFAFSKVEEHQIESLKSIREGAFTYKIADEPFRGAEDSNRFHRKKPFDMIILPTSTTPYIAICFYYPRKLKRILFFTLSDWRDFESSRKMRSFVYTEGVIWSSFYIDLVANKYTACNA